MIRNRIFRVLILKKQVPWPIDIAIKKIQSMNPISNSGVRYEIHHSNLFPFSWCYTEHGVVILQSNRTIPFFLHLGSSCPAMSMHFKLLECHLHPSRSSHESIPSPAEQLISFSLNLTSFLIPGPFVACPCLPFKF